MFVGALCRRIVSRGVEPRSLISSPEENAGPKPRAVPDGHFSKRTRHWRRVPVLGVASQCKAIRNRLCITIYTRIGNLFELRKVMAGLPPIHPAAVETICAILG